MSPRILSLLPAATEWICALGLGDHLVGVSHECDYPAQVRTLPRCSEARVPNAGSSAEIHENMLAMMAEALSIYTVDVSLIRDLQPTHILTQDQCAVCAVSPADLEEAVCGVLPGNPRIISAAPTTLEGILSWMDQIAEIFAVGAQAKALRQDYNRRVAAVGDAVRGRPRPRVATVEWVEPLMSSGNWVPEMIAAAGGESCFGEPGKHSPWMHREDLVNADPDLLIIKPCGFEMARARAACEGLLKHPEIAQMRAVVDGRVYVVDGHQYFNRPGPRIIDALEILGAMLHPNCIPRRHDQQAWQVF